jgi:hypothetical protein
MLVAVVVVRRRYLRVDLRVDLMGERGARRQLLLAGALRRRRMMMMTYWHSVQVVQQGLQVRQRPRDR